MILKRLFRTINFMVKHPIASINRKQTLTRFLRWQIGCRLFPYPIIYPFVENSKLVIEKGMTGATGNIYVGLHDFEEMGFTLHLLRSEDLFADIGANIGSFTIIASAVAEAKTICFEPIPSSYKYLLRNIHINDICNKVKPFNVGLGSEPGIIRFSLNLDTTNHVLAENEEYKTFIEVSVETLDNYCKINIPLLIKMDVEGFEFYVLKGGEKTFSNPQLKAIIIEINGSGNHYGIEDKNIHEFISKKGFLPYSYNPLTRNLDLLSNFNPNSNTIYIRDFIFVKNRIQNQRKFRVLTLDI